MLVRRVKNGCVVNNYLSLIILTIITAMLFSCDPHDKLNRPNNLAPDVPSNLNPADNSLNQSTNISLTWHCSDPDGDSLRYDIYFGITANPPLVASNKTDTSYNPGILEYITSYFWQVKAVDTHGDTASGPICTFRTQSFSSIRILGACDIPAVPADWYSLNVSGNFVYLAGAGSPMFAFDVSDPSQPALISQYGDGDLMISQIAIKEGTAYLAEAMYGLETVDIANPANPAHLDGYHAQGLVNSVILKENYAYLAGSNGITTLDISNPSNLVPLDTSDGQAGVMEVIGDYAYTVGNCGFERACLGWFEIHDRTSFEFVYSIDLASHLVEGFVADSRYLFISYYNLPLEVYSLNSPSNPQLIHSWPHMPLTEMYAPFINGNLLYISKVSQGVNSILIYNIEDIQNPVLLSYLNYQDQFAKILVANNYIYAISDAAMLLILGYTL